MQLLWWWCCYYWPLDRIVDTPVLKIKTKIVTFTINGKNKIDQIPLKSLKILSQEENRITVSYEKNNIKIDEIIAYFSNKNINILDISTDDGNIEDVYTTLTKN